jgi:Cytochrome P450
MFLLFGSVWSVVSSAFFFCRVVFLSQPSSKRTPTTHQQRTTTHTHFDMDVPGVLHAITSNPWLALAAAVGFFFVVKYARFWLVLCWFDDLLYSQLLSPVAILCVSSLISHYCRHSLFFPSCVCAIIFVLRFLHSAHISLFSLSLSLRLWQRSVGSRSRGVPQVPNALPLVGHLFQLLRPCGAWDTIVQWTREHGTVLGFNFFGVNMVAVAEPKLIKRIFNTKFRIYQKDSITYEPFLCLLGTGLVTSEGELWKRQRLLLAAVFRLEILEEMGQVAIKAMDRLLEQLQVECGSNRSVNIQEMFRVLTLQVIGEAVLSMPPDQSDKCALL